MVAPHVHGDIIEIGAGHGTMAARLTKLGRVTANEPSARAVALLRERFADDPLVTVAEGYASEVMASESYDAAVMINVLEHIPDEVEVLRGIFDGQRQGVTFAVFVPAHEALYSRFDHAIGHRRRYRRSTLNQVLSRAGFDIVDLRYVNLPGAFAWLLIARLLSKQPTESAAARVFDRVVVPILRRVETGRTPPFGLSLLAIGRRPQNEANR
jgi:SAM-dependent methyltransferase